jgi:hypothetical protein
MGKQCKEQKNNKMGFGLGLACITCKKWFFPGFQLFFAREIATFKSNKKIVVR